MEITINKQDVIENLHKVTGNLALKLGAPELIASTEEDVERIAPLWNNASLDLLHVLSPYADMLFNNNGVVYSLEMPVNWKVSQRNNLFMQCAAYIKQALVVRWLDFVKPDSAMLYRTLNQNIAEAIQHILTLRQKPDR